MAAPHITRVEKGDRPEVIALARRVWGDTTADRLDRHWEWKFESNPANMGEPPVIWTARDEEGIYAVVAGMWARLKVGETVTQEIWTTDFMADSTRRGRIGLEIGKYSMYWGPHITMGYPMSERVYSLWMRLGGADSDPMLIHSCSLRPGYKLLRMNYPDGIARLGNIAWRTAMGLRRMVVKGPAPDVKVTEITSFDAAYDDLWERVAPDYPVIAVRDQAYLVWRFQKCPSRRYRILQASRNGELTGYLACRLAETGRPRAGYIVDALTKRDDGDSFRSLMIHAVQLLKGMNADTVHFYSTEHSPILTRELRRAGFLASRVSTRGCYFDNADDSRELDLAKPDQWHCTHADSDQDLY